MGKLGIGAGALVFALGCGSDGSKPETDIEHIEAGQTPLEKLIIGLGGQKDLDALTGLRIVGAGQRNIVHESPKPGDAPIAANSFARKVSIDLSEDAFRVDTSRTIEFLFPGSQTYTDVVRGNLGASTEPFFGMPLGALGSDKTASIRRQETLLAPQLLLRQLTPSSFTTEPDVQLNGVTHHRLLSPGGPAPVTLYVNAETGELSKVETLELDFYMRDVPLELFYENWAPAGDINFPRTVRLARDGLTLLTETIQEVTVNPEFDAGTFDFPGGATPTYDAQLYARGVLSSQWYYSLDSLGLPFNGVDTSITAKEVAPGVTQLVGASHHSLVVEQENGIVLVDAPLHEDRGRALSQFIATTFPGKPLTRLVVSHYHEDHVSGVREVLGENPSAELVVHESTRDFWRNVLASPSTLRPDSLAQAPRSVNIVTVPDAGELTFDDPAHPVTVSSIRTGHAADMLLTRETASNTVFVVDIYSPGNATQLNAADFANALTTLAVPTDNLKIIGGHGGEIHDFATLQSSLQ